MNFKKILFRNQIMICNNFQNLKIGLLSIVKLFLPSVIIRLA